MSSLQDKTVSGLFWSFLQKIGSRSVHLLTTILLARVLLPSDFGLIGMLSIFIALGQALMNGGFSEALLRKKEVDEEDYSSVFYINLIISAFLYLLLFLGAPWIGEFYHQALLVPLTRTLGLVFIINAFSYVQETRLQREMRFKTLMWAHVPSTILSGIVAILMAFQGYGVWSIVAQQIVVRLAYAIQIWIFSKWSPLRRLNIAKAKTLFSFGSRLMLSTIVGAVYGNAYLMVIGRFFSPSLLGFYQTANNLVEYPAFTFTQVVTSVTFPAFSTMQDDNMRLKVNYRRTIQQLLFWMTPIFILAGVLATPLFRLVFTAKWLPAVSYFRWICVAGVFYPINSYVLTILNVKGRSDVFLRLEIIRCAIATIGIIVTIPLGIKAVVIFQVFNAVVVFFLNSYYSGRFIGYRIFQQVKDLLPTLMLGISVGGAVLGLDTLVSFLPDVLRVICGSVFGIGLYWLGAHLLKFSPWLEFKQILSRYPTIFFSNRAAVS